MNHTIKAIVIAAVLMQAVPAFGYTLSAQNLSTADVTVTYKYDYWLFGNKSVVRAEFKLKPNATASKDVGANCTNRVWMTAVKNGQTIGTLMLKTPGIDCQSFGALVNEQQYFIEVNDRVVPGKPTDLCFGVLEGQDALTWLNKKGITNDSVNRKTNRTCIPLIPIKK